MKQKRLSNDEESLLAGNELVLKPGDMEWGMRQEAFTVDERGNAAVDSERADVTYEAYRGHRLDRKMLDVLRQG